MSPSKNPAGSGFLFASLIVFIFPPLVLLEKENLWWTKGD